MEGSYELNPFHQKQVDQLKPVSFRFFAGLILSCGILGLLGWYNRGPGQVPHATEFVVGGMLLIEAVIHMRHVRNIYAFRRMLRSEGAAGSMRISRSFGYGMSSVDLTAFAALWLGLFALTGRAGFIGGSVFCFASALRDFWMSKRSHPPAPSPAA